MHLEMGSHFFAHPTAICYSRVMHAGDISLLWAFAKLVIHLVAYKMVLSVM